MSKIVGWTRVARALREFQRSNERSCRATLNLREIIERVELEDAAFRAAYKAACDEAKA